MLAPTSTRRCLPGQCPEQHGPAARQLPLGRACQELADEALHISVSQPASAPAGSAAPCAVGKLGLSLASSDDS